MIPRPWLYAPVLLIALVGCGKNEASSPEPKPTPKPLENQTVEIKRDINYAMSAGPERAYDLYLPTTGDPNRPLLIFIHGGAWQSGDKKDYEGMGKAFANAGIAVAVVNYQLSPKVQHPKHIEDVAFAYGHLANNVQGFDPKRIFVMGHSAGAHMCGLMAADPDMLMRVGTNKDHYPKGMIGLEGIYDIPNLVKVWPAYKDGFIEKAFGKEIQWVAASPARYPLRLKRPWLLVHASGDELVDMDQTKHFVDQLKMQEIKVEFHDPGNQRHFQVVQELAKPDSDLYQRVKEFIEANSKSEVAPPQ